MCCNVSLVTAMACCIARGGLAQDNHWVGTWGCGVQLTEPRNLPPAPGLAGNTLRQIVHVSIGGKELRVHFSNIFGTSAVIMKSVHIALNPSRMTSSKIDPRTDKALAFDGDESVVIPPGRDVWSDPVSFDLPPLTNLAITIRYGAASLNVTGHPSSRADSYILSGNAVSSKNMAGAIQTEHWYNIEDVDVRVGKSYDAVVTFGDSITDGRGSTTDGNNRWPDDLAYRLHTYVPTAHVSVVNMSIGGNGIFGGLGPSAESRFDRDVLHQSGVRWLIVFEGVNDIGSPHSSLPLVKRLIAAYRGFIIKSHKHHIRVYGATITPFGRSFYDSKTHEAMREAVNKWIRTNQLYDAVIDFDAVVRDPKHPAKLLPAYDSGDHLHLNPVGYHAMANAINLKLFASGSSNQ